MMSDQPLCSTGLSHVKEIMRYFENCNRGFTSGKNWRNQTSEKRMDSECKCGLYIQINYYNVSLCASLLLHLLLDATM